MTLIIFQIYLQLLENLDDFDDCINGARDICNLVSKANGWRDTN